MRITYNDIMFAGELCYRLSKGKLKPNLTNKSDCVYWYIQDKILYVVVHGSDDVKDWINNVKIKTNSLGVNEELYKCFKPIGKELVNVIEKNEIEDIFLTGWSRGGGGACAIKDHIRTNFPYMPIKTITIVSMRYYTESYKRFVNDTIFITQPFGVVDDLPPKIAGYVDKGQYIKLKPRFWYFLTPSILIRLTMIHKKWWSNIKRRKNRKHIKEALKKLYLQK